MSAVASKKKTSRKTPPSGKGLTFEKVWALMQKNAEQEAKRKKEFDRQIKELAEREAKQKKEFEQWKKKLAEQEAELKKKLAEEEAKRKKELDEQEAKWKKELAEREAERKKELDEKEAERKNEFEQKKKKDTVDMEELRRIVRRNGKQLGECHLRFGQLAEHLVAPGIVRRFNELGYNFDSVGKGFKLYGEDGKIKSEIDLLLENGKTIIAIEVKSRPVVQDVEHHIKRLEILREKRNLLNDQRKVLGAIAGAIYEDIAKEAVREAGLFVIEQSGDTMKIDMPEGFIPREW